MRRATPRDRTFVFPLAEYEAFQKAQGGLRARSLVAGGGEPWREQSRQNAWNGYCDGLQALHRAGLYDPAEPPQQRWAQRRIDALLNAKKPSGRPYAPLTIGTWLIGAVIVVRTISPDTDVSALLAAERGLPRKGVRAKFLVDPEQLRDWSGEVMREALMVIRAWHDQRPTRAIPLLLLDALERYRTALQIVQLSLIALRLRNLTSIALGQDENLFQLADQWWLVFARNEMKGKKAYDRALPEEAGPWLETYLAEVRPLLARRAYDGNRLWLSRRGGPQSDQSIRKNIKKATKERYGTSITPHWFRDCVATSIAKAHPADLKRASWTLANQPDTTNLVYNHAGTAPARQVVVERFAAVASWDRLIAEDAIKSEVE